MLSKIALPLLLAGIASAQTSDVISFPFVGDGYYTVVPTEGVSGSIVDVKDSRTTMVYECDTYASNIYQYSTVGVLCPLGTNRPVSVTFGDNYWGQLTSVSTAGISATYDQDCDVTATPASNGGISAVESPVCTMSFGGEYAETLAGLFNCAGNVDADDIDTDEFYACLTSATATPTKVAVMTLEPTNVWYWTVTVTAVAEGVNTAAAAATGSSASATATGSAGNAAAGTAVSRLSIAGVVGLAAVVLAL
ncbi:hypothetical protein DBV05_g4104 [Lasiodiplodia theobromae]|uniref:Uncharacterized protein n=1 Tax=Lasiodiplodia theobromae TaxID=45133 RepID=A0A5N5DI57_9PEZI|nr:hypothetical protein DBV05_g4104 [Lasiodiplodia theobromae]